MSEQTNIEWTDSTWNPWRGCTRVSPGCTNCYAEAIAHRFSGENQPYEGLTHPTGIWNGKIKLVPEKLDQPLRWKKPRKIFVNSMSDMFHENIPPDMIHKVFKVMNQAHQHQFQILTKRPLTALTYNEEVRWTPNIWLGVSVESIDYISRIWTLQESSARVKFISFEPLINSVGKEIDLTKIDWAIVGGESGPGARLMRMNWAREIYRACKEQDVAFFMKQIGSVSAKNIGSKSKKGGDITEFPDQLQVREYPK